MAKTALYEKNFELARAYITPLLEKYPLNASTWDWASSIELQDKNFDQAISYIKKAIKWEPNNPFYLYNYATSLALSGQKTKAIEIFQQVLAIKPDMYQAINNLGHSLRDIGKIQEAIECYQNVFLCDVRDLRILSQILLSLHYFCFDNHEALYEMHCDLGRRIANRAPPFSPVWRPKHREIGEKIRLGYLSPRFSREIVSYFFKPIFDNHDRSRFELYLYSATVRQDDMTEYFAHEADNWADITQLTDTALCQKIVDDRIDILIDLAGHAPENRITTTARKPSPVQISMLDYSDTTGIKAIDYYVSDSFSTPAGGKQRFIEELIIMGQPRLVYEAPTYAPPIRVRNPDHGEIVFGSYNRHQKIIPEVVRAWSALLNEVSGSHLVLKSTGLEHTETQAIYLHRFGECGITPERISFRGKSTHPEMLAEYGDIDIALDTFPYNGGLTTLEALWMGTPVIAIEGERIISRQSAGILHSLGLADFVAQSPGEFVAIGKYWSQHRKKLNDLRESLRDRMSASPITNAVSYTRDLERQLQKVWDSYLAQQSR